METVSIVAGGLAAVLGGGLAVVGFHAAELRRRLVRAGGEARAAIAVLESQLEQARVEDKKKECLLDHQQEELDFFLTELEKRPKITRKTYKIITVGVKWTGKTSLTLKWANPLVDLGMLPGTKIERYERTVSLVTAKDVITEHVFEIGDWGGEHIVDALHELIMEEVHGLLIVVDLGGKDAKGVDSARVEQQVCEFRPQSLQYFFGTKTVASCKTVVLFINKSDLLSGTPPEVEAQAKKLYASLIADLSRYKEKVDVHVLVGSACYGHSTHVLFSHFVEKILPKNAYDNQLLQRMKMDLAAPHEAPAKRVEVGAHAPPDGHLRARVKA